MSERIEERARAERADRRIRKRRIDLVVGIVLGLVIGVAIVAVFVFQFSEQTVDAPQLDEGRPPAEQPADP